MVQNLDLHQGTLSIRTHENISPIQWDAFVDGHRHGHILQSAAWGALKSTFGWYCRRVAMVDAAGTLVGGAQILFRRVAGLTIAYVPRGPVTEWSDGRLTRRIWDAMVDCCALEGATLLKVEPHLIDTPSNRHVLRNLGMQPTAETIQPPSTIVVDISGDEAAILNRMKSKWRYNIRLATRKGVTVREATWGDLPVFDEMMAETGGRDGFVVHSSAYYAAAFRHFVPDRAVYLLAEYQGEPLGAIVVFVLGETAWYLWGASSSRQRNRMPNHALQWAGMRWARQQGAQRYDLWGIPDEIGQLSLGINNWDGSPVASSVLPLDLNALPERDLWGVYRFKQGFGGDVLRYVGAWELPLQPGRYQLYKAALQARSTAISMRQQGAAWRAARLHAAGPALPADTRAVATAVEWRAILEGLPDPHVLQSWEWGDLKEQTGWHAHRLVVERDGRPAAAFQFLWRQLNGTLPVRIGYVPKGPTVDWSDDDLVDITLDRVERYAAELGCFFVKIDPDVREDRIEGLRLLHALGRRRWRYSAEQIQFKNSATTVLTGGQEALLAGMKSKWRYNIRLATRREIIVRSGGLADLATFYDLYAQTGHRDGFLIRPFGYYESIWSTFLQAQQDASNPAGGALLLAEKADDPLAVAALFLFRYGERTWYFYGASSERHRRDMPNYLLQYEAMRWALEQGCTTYDWWGAPTDPDDDADAMAGVWRFKQGFGAELQPHVGAWDFVLSPWLYAAYAEAMPRMLATMRRIRS